MTHVPVQPASTFVAPLNTARGAVLAMVAVVDYFKQHGEMPR